MSEKLKDSIIAIVAFGLTILIYSLVYIDLTGDTSANEVESNTTEAPVVTSETTTEVITESTTIEETTTEEATEPVNTRREVTDEEYELLLRVCMSECGGNWGETLEAKVAVVETILNRVDLGYGSISEVVYAPNQYSTADNGNPDISVARAVECALTMNSYPDNMIYFRTDHYHSFGIPYKKIGSHYFSLLEVE